MVHLGPLPESEKRRMKPMTFGLILFAVLLLVGASISMLATNYRYSEGFRVGTVDKFSRRGILFKTWEGQLVMDRFPGGRPPAGEQATLTVWRFTVESADVREALERATEHDGRVKLTYCEYLRVWPWRGETVYFVEKVEVLK